jgi:hypothetical protein
MDYLVFLSFVAWFLLLGTIIYYVFVRKLVSGISLAFFVNIFLYHFITEFVYYLGQVGYLDRAYSGIGYEVSGLVPFALLAGIFSGNFFVKIIFKKSENIRVVPKSNFNDKRYILYIISVGLTLFIMFWLGRYTGVNLVIGIFTSLGGILAITGLVLYYSVSAKKSSELQSTLILLPTLFIPVVTTIFGGFIGFGIQLIISVFMFYISNVKNKVLFLLLPIAIYFGISLWVSYAPFRTELRFKIDSETSAVERLAFFSENLTTNWAWFSPWDDKTVVYLARFDQNAIIGLSAERLESKQIDFLNGETLLNIIYAPIPRMLWPGKPELTGGNQLITQYTGRAYDVDTSVGIGLVLELYINFGKVGVVVSFYIFGLIIFILDLKASEALKNNDYRKFVILFAVAQPLINTLENLGSITASTVALLLFLYLNNIAYGSFFANRLKK